MRGVSKFVLALAVVALLSVGLVACGGGDSSSSTSGSSTATATESTSTTTTEDQGSGQSGNGGEKESGDDKGGSDSDSGSDDNSSSEEGSASFRTPGGDNSIQNYGEEADGGETEAANAALTAYLTARAKGDWAKQCALLSKAAVEPLEQLASRASQLKGKSCAAILAALMAQGPASTRANPLTGGVASLRFEGEQGFALFHGPDGTDYFVPMVNEDGKWKVGAIAPSEFP